MANKKKLKRRIKKLQHKAWLAKHKRKVAVKDAKFWREIVNDQDDEIEQLKASKVQVWLNGEPVEVVIDANEK